jgi:hypothetical protein
MNTLSTLDPTHPAAPAFTLGSALRWLGHDCTNHCSDAIDGLTASVWFLRRGPHLLVLPLETLVLLDPTDTGKALAHVRRMIYEVDCCTRDEAIHVRCRREGENGPVLAGAWGSVVAGNGIQISHPQWDDDFLDRPNAPDVQHSKHAFGLAVADDDRPLALRVKKSADPGRTRLGVDE